MSTHFSSRSYLTVITGCMWAGKSSEILRLIRRCEAAKYKVVLIGSSIDTRSGEHLKTHEIQTRRFFPALDLQPCYKDMEFRVPLPNSNYLYNHGLSLPSAATHKDEEIKEVATRIKEFYKK